MFQRYGILCVLLFLMVLILAYENYEIWSSPRALAPQKEGDKKGEGKPEPLPSILAPKETAPRQSFNVIGERNIFNPDRKEFFIQATPGTGIGKPFTRPPITLYGVVISENYQVASIGSPGRPLHKGEREIKTVRIGESVGEYKVAKIMPDRIVLESGEGSLEVLLYDPRYPKRRKEIRTPSPSTKVTSTVSPSPARKGKPMLPPGAIVPPVATPPTPGSRPIIPQPAPLTPGLQPREGLQSPTPPGQTSTPSALDPGLWRGRRPLYPGRPPG